VLIIHQISVAKPEPGPRYSGWSQEATGKESEPEPEPESRHFACPKLEPDPEPLKICGSVTLHHSDGPSYPFDGTIFFFLSLGSLLLI
jgi:hypothetical protein